MRVYDRYLATLAAVFGGATAVMAMLDVREAEAYFSAYLICFLGVTLMNWHVLPRARPVLGVLSLVLAMGALALISAKALSLLLNGSSTG